MLQTVTNNDWNVGACGTMTDTGYTYAFEPFKCNHPYSWEHILKPGCYGMKFPSTEAYSAYALEHGFLERYFCRPWAFIGLKLSPASRRYAKNLTTIKARWAFLEKILPKTERGSYFRAVKTAGYMKKERDRWMRYIATGGQDPDSDPRRFNKATSQPNS